MQEMYPYAQIIHLFLVIIFLGYIFFDVIIFPIVKKRLGSEVYRSVKEAITKRAIKIMPLSLLFIVLSGGIMMNSYVGSIQGWLDTPLQKLFMLKVFLACLIVIGVIFSLSLKVLGKNSPSFMKNHFHTFALIVGFIIVFLAKAMFLV